jgi:alginate O-acetyltransferase complex protein AlgI
LPMEFNSLVFLFLFLPLALLFHFILRPEARKISLVVISLFFYSWGEGEHLLLLILLLIINYYLAGFIEKQKNVKKKKQIFISAISFNLILLVGFKYSYFLAENSGIHLKPFPIPIGISFITFMFISYLVDVYRQTAATTAGFSEFALYISFFPKLISGPITLYHRFYPQIKKQSISTADFSEGIRRFILGLGKKVLIADYLSISVNCIFSIPSQELNASLAWLGIVNYTLQIYFDFSGYSDMAIGLGKMLGFTIPENFNFPYLSASIKEFWKRWHITLGEWLQNYLFLPIAYGILRRIPRKRLLGIRTEHWAYHAGIFTTFLLCGIWHGANWTFMAWGVYYGILLMVEHAGWGKFMKKRMPRIIRILYSLLLVMFGWVIFRSPNLPYAFGYIRALLGQGGGDGTLFYPALYLSSKLWVMMIIGIVGSFPVMGQLHARMKSSLDRMPTTSTRCRIVFCHGYNLVSSLFLTAVILASVMVMATGTFNAFIYFRF